MEQCDYLGTVSGEKCPDKVQRTGLTPVKSELVDAPYFEELPVTMECELLRTDPEEDDISLRILGTVKNVSIGERLGRWFTLGKLYNREGFRYEA